jgi:hypothetical protein
VDKNHRLNNDGCYGIDLNRNFDAHWMYSGSSGDGCSEIYAGEYAASEKEIISIQNYIMSKYQRWSAYFSLHSYGAYWMTNYGYSKSHILENFLESVNVFNNYNFFVKLVLLIIIQVFKVTDRH